MWGLLKKFQDLFKAECPKHEEDKYGNRAILKRLNDEYRCPNCGAILDYGNATCTTLICGCGFTKPAPPKEEAKK